MHVTSVTSRPLTSARRNTASSNGWHCSDAPLLNGAVFATVIAYAPFRIRSVGRSRRRAHCRGCAKRHRACHQSADCRSHNCVHHVRNHLQPHVGAALPGDTSRVVPRISRQNRTDSGTFGGKGVVSSRLARTPGPLLRVRQTGEFVLGSSFTLDASTSVKCYGAMAQEKVAPIENRQ